MRYLISLLMFWASSVSAASPAACNYCEGYKVLEKAMTEVSPPASTQAQTTEQSNVVTLADKLLQQILKENPKLDAKGLEYFTKIIAKASLYDQGNDLVSNFWENIGSRRKEVDQKLKELVSGKQISAAEAKRLTQALSAHESTLKNGNG